MLPLALYIHIPWCIRKCPYCDFNSHKSPDTLPEANYVSALLADLNQDIIHVPSREITSIFIGGGTPSLFSAEAYEQLFDQIQQKLPFAPDIEITLEANPGTFEQERFRAYREVGINRLSIGIQSFNPDHLKTLGRVHDDQQAHQAIETARKAGFERINLDLMHGLPQQTVAQGLEDLTKALAHEPEHLSWYQLTIEPNTVFYKQQPSLPSEDDAFELEEQGLSLLKEAGFQRYEISAFCQPEKQARHNLNYWLFGDYLGIGAGAHGKLSTSKGIFRTQKHRQPKDYLDPQKPFMAKFEEVQALDLLFEFMLNSTRLEQAIPYALFEERTGLSLDRLKPALFEAEKRGLVQLTKTHWQVTALGRRYTNDLQGLFLS